MSLHLEVNANCKDRTTKQTNAAGGLIIMSPNVDETYWLFRVAVSPTQAIVGFPKFFTIGIGFQHEEDWNTNLPYSEPAEKIYGHIKHNLGDATVTRETVIEAIRLVQQAAADYQGSSGMPPS